MLKNEIESRKNSQKRLNSTVLMSQTYVPAALTVGQAYEDFVFNKWTLNQVGPRTVILGVFWGVLGNWALLALDHLCRVSLRPVITMVLGSVVVEHTQAI